MGIESPVHLLFIAVVALIVLGPRRLPKLARALGQGIREFRQSLDEGANQPEQQAPPAQTVAPAASASSPTPTPPPPPPPSPTVSTAPAAPPGSEQAPPQD